jgi:hypothetical protein
MGGLSLAVSAVPAPPLQVVVWFATYTFPTTRGFLLALLTQPLVHGTFSIFHHSYKVNLSPA